MIAPIVTLTVAAVALLLITGGGDIRAGNGALAVMCAVIMAWGLLMAMLLADRVFSLTKLLTLSIVGMKQLLPAAVVLVLSFAFGDAVKAYGTGDYISSALGLSFPQLLIAPLLFIIAGAMAFATGTSWGTFAVLIPIAMPLADSTGLPASLLVAAVLGGGVFGDHSSPISDSTIIASLASGCDHIEHVRTQLPYNLVAAGLSVLLYGLLSALVS
jgi:Na+/H+ antiporter NhaC